MQSRVVKHLRFYQEKIIYGVSYSCEAACSCSSPLSFTNYGISYVCRDVVHVHRSCQGIYIYIYVESVLSDHRGHLRVLAVVCGVSGYIQCNHVVIPRATYFTDGGFFLSGVARTGDSCYIDIV